MKLSAVTAFVALCASNTFAATIFVTDQNSTNTLVSIDTGTGTATTIGAIGHNVSGLAMSPTGDLYGITRNDLISINTGTGAGTLIGAHGLSGAEGLTFLSDGTLIGSSSSGGQLSSINLTTGAGTSLGNISPARDIDGLTVAPVAVSTIAGNFAAGTIFMADSNNILAINPVTLATTTLGSASANEGIAFNSDGTLFGGGTGQIHEINLLTLATVNSYSASFTGFVGGMTSATPFSGSKPPAPVPLPAGAPLLLAGLGTLAAVRRKR